MARFFRNFVKTPQPEFDQISKIIERIWFRYDDDRSGYLDKRESLRFLKDVLQ